LPFSISLSSVYFSQQYSHCRGITAQTDWFLAPFHFL
jgi:hypothetical protein